MDEATATFTEALTLAREQGNLDLIATTLANLASVALRQGNIAYSVTLSREALALYSDLADPRRCAVGLEGVACSAGMAGQGERAARLLGAAVTLRVALGTPLPPLERGDIDQCVAAARAAMGEECWEAAFAEGQALTQAQAIVEALGE